MPKSRSWLPALTRRKRLLIVHVQSAIEYYFIFAGIRLSELFAVKEFFE